MPYDATPWPARFWQHVPVPAGDECMEWTGHRTPFGYGNIHYAGRRHGAHRMSWMLANGPIPEGLHVCHRCDNPPCVRPDHLFLGTAKDNARDRQNKGRHTPPVFSRENHPMRKLTAEQCAEIVGLHRPGHGGNTLELAAQFGVSRVTISHLAKEASNA